MPQKITICGPIPTYNPLEGYPHELYPNDEA